MTTNKHEAFSGDLGGRINGVTCHGCGMLVNCPCCGDPVLMHGHVQINSVDEKSNIRVSAVWCSVACLFRALTNDMTTVADSDWPRSSEAAMIAGVDGEGACSVSSAP